MSNEVVKKYLKMQEKNSKINYDLIMEQALKEMDTRQSILIHSCCAVCSTVALEKLSEKMDVTLFFYNPNIHPKSEYLRRALENEKLVNKFNDFFNRDVKFEIGEYKYSEFVKATKGLEHHSERSGIRCAACYSMRLDVCAKSAKENGYDYWATALTLSPLKNAHVINTIGLETAAINDTNFFVCDFKKNKGNIIATEMCEKFDVYRQCYCGCHYAYTEQGIDIKAQIEEAKRYLSEVN